MLPVSLNCPFLIASSVLSYVYHLGADLGHTLQYEGFNQLMGLMGSQYWIFVDQSPNNFHYTDE